MRWTYKKITESDDVVEYAYAHMSHESQDLDGRIVYDKKNQELLDVIPCKDDVNKKAVDWSLTHFCKVIRDGFPEIRYVCCG